MAPRPSAPTNARDDAVRALVTDLGDRLEETEARLALLETTLRGVTDASGVTIGPPCSRCRRSYLLLETGTMSCPACGFRSSV